MPFGEAILWPSFGAEPQANISFRFTFAYLEIFSKTSGWFTAKLDRGVLLGPFGITVSWPTFGPKPYTKITFMSALLFL